jgi:hypothetical protein
MHITSHRIASHKQKSYNLLIFYFLAIVLIATESTPTETKPDESNTTLNTMAKKSKSNGSSRLKKGSDMIMRRSGFEPGPILLGLAILVAIGVIIYIYQDWLVPCGVHSPSLCQKHSGCMVVTKAFKKDQTKGVAKELKMDNLHCVTAPGKRCADLKGRACRLAKPSDSWGKFGYERCVIDQLSSLNEPVAPCVKKEDKTTACTATGATKANKFDSSQWETFANAAFTDTTIDQLARMSTIWETSLSACPTGCVAIDLREHKTPADGDLPSITTAASGGTAVAFDSTKAKEQIDKLIAWEDAKGCQPYATKPTTEPVALFAVPCNFFKTEASCKSAEVWRNSTSSATCTWDSSAKCQAKNGTSISFKTTGEETDSRLKKTKT